MIPKQCIKDPVILAYLAWMSIYISECVMHNLVGSVPGNA